MLLYGVSRQGRYDMVKLRLGHIEYSNCIPVHSLLLDGDVPEGLELRRGVPSALNAELRAGTIDVAPSSSIEYARNAARYRLIPGFAIGSVGALGSVVLETDRPAEELDGEEVVLPTASATSVVLLRVLLETRLGVRPRYRWHEQSDDADPFAGGAAAALWIGDVALRRAMRTSRRILDLGELWTEWTGLPFVFALWQIAAGPERDTELLALQETLRESMRYFEGHVDELAARHAATYGLSPEHLAGYWQSLEYGLDERQQRGLLHFYRCAVELGEAPAVPELRWITG